MLGVLGVDAFGSGSSAGCSKVAFLAWCSSASIASGIPLRPPSLFVGLTCSWVEIFRVRFFIVTSFAGCSEPQMGNCV